MQPPIPKGFTLVEMALVLVIVGFMLGGLLTPLSMQLEQRKASETQRALDEAREAVLGFALRNGYLPCPAVSAGNGLEDRNGDNCSGGKRSGFLPWVTLGLPKLDSWGHIYRYSVTPAFSNSRVLFTLASRRDIAVGTRDAGGRLVGATAVNDIPAVILSHGKNGFAGVSGEGVPAGVDSASNLDERSNAGHAGIAFVTRHPSGDPAAPGGEFDDMLAWVSPNILYTRMVAAQKLP
ncbi:prepilin-type N-terminal cleavage/methylation domain-containing protein [Massilia glaciei]|uniref:Type II secretion system protein n=1 Tax=Massilia glaciei TaxID=1524097 RepID=A0A2U2HJU4_9BURK|nr:type II secretion system protein [Massilia glaciei]PWF47715.1 type II secretion system protein [Massilia glaciei]